MASISSCTNASASKPNASSTYGSIRRTNAVPGRSLCASSQPRRRSAMPCCAGMPPIPSFRRMRSDSAMPKCPSRKNALRGSVAIQFGLPRPAFRKACAAFLALHRASLISSSLTSNGLSSSYVLRLSACMCVGSLCQQHDDDHAPDCQQRVSHRVRHGVAEPWDLALGGFADHAECRGGGSRPGAAAQHDRRIEAEEVPADIDTEDQRQRGGKNTPQEQAEPDLLQARDESGAGGDSNHGD